MEDRVRHVSGTALSSGRRATSYLQGQGSRQGDITTGGGVATKHSVIGASASDANRKTRLPRFRQSVGSQKLASPRAARRSIYATRTKFDTRESDGSPGLAGTSFEGQSSLDQRAGKPEKTLAFKICFVRRHDEFWSDKISVRSDNESPPEILCLHYDIAERNMFLGLSNGTLMAWTDAFEPATSSDPQASSNGPTVMKAQGHSGAISSLVFLRTLAPDRALRDDCKKPRNDHPPGVPASSSLQAALVCSKTVEREGGFLFTGSADRNIKLWVVEQRKLVCVRTLCFHGGTVVSLAYCFPYLFSASTDGTALVCRAEQTSGSLKYPHFTVVERVFAHSIYHPSTKLVLSNKQAWYDSLAVRCNGDRICLYCGATDGSLLVLENTQTYVPAKPVVGSGGAPPVNLHTQERATVWSEARERASTAIGRGRLYSSLLCNTSCWGSISGPEVGEDVGYGYHGEKIPAGAASYARETIQSVALPVPFRLQNKLTVHTLGLRKVYALPLESAVATLGSDASISVVDPVAGQTSWKEENPEGCCYSACAWMSSLNLLLVGDSCGCLSFYNIYSKERVHSQQVTEHRIVSLSIATHERNVVVSTAHEVLLVEVIEAAEEVALTGHQGAVMHMLWQPTAEGGYMYSSADDTTIRQWDVQKGLCTRIIRHKYADITSWMLIDALNGFVTGHEDGDVRFWYLRDFSSFSIQNQKGHHIHINSVTGMCCWRPTSTAKPEDHKRSKVITNAEDDNASSNGIEHSRISPNVERDLAVTPPIYQVLTCGYDGRLNVTEIRADAETGEITTKIIDQLTDTRRSGGAGDEILYCVSFDQRRCFFTAGNGCLICKWSLRSMTPDDDLVGHQDGVTCLSSVGGNLVSGSLDKSIRIWDIDAAECTRVINNQPEPACCIAPLNDGYIGMWACISSSGLVSVWDSSCRLVLSKAFNESIGCCVCVGTLGQLLLGTEKGNLRTLSLGPAPSAKATGADNRLRTATSDD